MNPFTIVVLVAVVVLVVGLAGYALSERYSLTESLAGALALLAAVVLLFSGGAFGARALKGEACERKAESLGYEHKVGYVGGCRIEVNGRFIPIDNYRVTTVEAP